MKPLNPHSAAAPRETCDRPQHSRLIFIGAVLAFGIVQQLGRPKDCAMCRINRALRSEQSLAQPSSDSAAEMAIIKPPCKQAL